MDLTANICIACCMIHSKTSLTQLVMTSNDSLSKILLQDCPRNLAICTNCNLKLEGFKEFIEKLKNNITLLKMIKSERENDREITGKTNSEDCPTIDVIKDANIVNVCDSSTNNINIAMKKCNTFENERMEELVDTSSTNSEKDSVENELNDEPVSPPPSSESCTFFNNFGLPILVPSSSQESSLAKYIRTSDERRKQRNREASRRYRERARGDPALLQKMREQQNVRQKKYYERCRMKKLMEAESKTSEIVNSNDLLTADNQL